MNMDRQCIVSLSYLIMYQQINLTTHDSRGDEGFNDLVHGLMLDSNRILIRVRVPFSLLDPLYFL